MTSTPGLVDQLVAGGIVTRELVMRAEQVAPHVATSRAGRLIAAGGNAQQIVDALARLSGIPVVAPELLNRAGAVHLLPATAQRLSDAAACPVRRDPEGTLHIIIADPDAYPVLDKFLVGFKAYLAPETRVRQMLRELYGIGADDPMAGSVDPADAIDIDLDASRRNAPAPSPTQATLKDAAALTFTAAATSSLLDAIDLDPRQPSSSSLPSSAASSSSHASPFGVVPGDPLAARPSGKHRRPQDEEETQRVQRAPRPGASSPMSSPMSPSSPISSPLSSPLSSPMSSASAKALDATSPLSMNVLDERTVALRPAPSPERRAFMRGVAVGAGATGFVALIIIIALLAR